MSAILVTGGAGFIGANFVRHWRATHPADEIVILDALTYAGHRENLDGIGGVELVEGDIRDFELVQKLLAGRNVGRIAHFAAESHVDRSIHGPDIFIETNVLGTLSVLKAAKAVWLDTGSGRAHRFHHISTDEVYGSLGPDDPAFREISRYAPNSPYAASKAGADHLVRAFHATYGLDTTISNCSNNYGPFQSPEKLIPLFLINALHGEALPIYGDGMQRRDWLHVGDHCRAIQAVIEDGKSGDVYNVGGGAELPNLELIDRICATVDRLFETDPSLAERFPEAPAAKGLPSASLKSHVEDRLGHDRRYAIDDSKIAAELGCRPVRSIDEGLEETVRWYLDNETWWRAVMVPQAAE
ncbi:dTDP-glucose 4,6-dehydratase [Parasphingopyxis algicola]|uniref:dTDP-glucose 4,6-dehydratase n=1 Tax=Parasphingopyxis algicola TaxID=2026624 RepID=UPI0015A40603|nr:dTDP-glucose 4,6-dehydratase [Parasphingopyxis algicola]QLC24020.1 dTDP-glucose 4,6-dehydratase [Parasphingopyxis algicola]